MGNGGGAPTPTNVRGGGETTSKKKGLQQTKEKKHPLRHRERGARSIYATFATRLIRHCIQVKHVVKHVVGV